MSSVPAQLAAIMASDPQPSVAAFFDVDGTIVNTTVVHYYAYFVTQDRSRLGRGLFWAAFTPQLLSLFILDKISRSAFNRVFYRRYRGMEASRLRTLAEELLEEELKPRLFSDAVARIEQHQAQGERVVFVTGSLDFIVAPLARMLGVKDVIAVRMSEANGLLTGELAGLPIGNEEKARRVRTFAEAQEIDLAESFAYGDSRADLPMLRCVGHPVVVNPRGKLRRVAEDSGWEVAEWKVERSLKATD